MIEIKVAIKPPKINITIPNAIYNNILKVTSINLGNSYFFSILLASVLNLKLYAFVISSNNSERIENSLQTEIS